MLIIFLRYPMPGKTKTRLIPAVGSVAAAALQHDMTLGTLAAARKFAESGNVPMEVRFTGGTLDEVTALYGADLRYHEQSDGDLGQRLAVAIDDGFRSGARRIVVIGTDAPALTSGHLHAANEALVDYDVVLGPALDGGYYLLGLRQPRRELFVGIEWSTERVFEQTVEATKRLGLTVHFLEALADIDRPADLYHLSAAQKNEELEPDN